jgi:hypothetical protein
MRAMRLGEVVDPLEVRDHVDLQAVVLDPLRLVGSEALGLVQRRRMLHRVDLALHEAHLAGRRVVLLVTAAMARSKASSTADSNSSSTFRVASLTMSP